MAAALLAPGGAAAQSRATFTLPHGQWEVGFRSVALYDSTRTVLALDAAGERIVPGTPRPVQTSIWYPARPVPNAETMTYRDYVRLFAANPLTFAADTPEGREQAEREFLSYSHLLFLSTRDQGWLARRRAEMQEAGRREFDVAMRAVRDAPPAAGPFPVVIYGPGAGGPSFENDILMEYLASHGYIVIASPSSLWGAGQVGGLSLEEQVRDFEFLIGYGRLLPGAGTGGVGLIGFSWGGIANVVTAVRNSAVAAVVTLDGSIRYFSTHDFARTALEHTFPYTTPTLFIDQGANSDTAFFRRANADVDNVFFANLRHADAMRVLMKTVDHQNLVAMYNRFSAPQPAHFVSDTAISNRAYEQASLFTLHFLNAHLKADAASHEFLRTSPAELGMPPDDVIIERRSALRPLPTAASFAAAARARGTRYALELLHEVRAANPTYTIPEPELSRWAWSLGNDSARLAGFRVLAELHPHSAGANSDLGDAFLAVGDTARAIQAFERVIELDPTSRHARTMLQRLKEDVLQKPGMRAGPCCRGLTPSPRTSPLVRLRQPTLLRGHGTVR